MAKKPEYQVGETYPLDVDTLKPNPHQVRKYFDEEGIEILAENIKEDGLLQSISFTSHEGDLVIVGGERRCRAIKLLKEQGVNADLTGKYVEGSLRKLAFVENLFREDMTAVEFAESVLVLQEEGDELSQGALGKLLGLKRTTINGILSVAKMPEDIRDSFRNNPHVSRDRLERISRIKGEGRQKKAVDALLSQLNAQKTGGQSEDGPLKGKTRGSMVASSLAKFTESLKRFSDAEYAIRISPDDRDLIVTRLNEMKEKIQATLEAMSQGKEDWDRAYAKSKAKSPAGNSDKKKGDGKPAKTKARKSKASQSKATSKKTA